MKAKYTIALAMLAGTTLGAAAIQGLHAQASPPVYFVAVKELTDATGYKTEYAPLAQDSIRSHGGKILAAGNSTVIAADPLKGRVVIIAWDDMEQLHGWFDSPEYKEVREIGEKYSQSRHYFAVPGVVR